MSKWIIARPFGVLFPYRLKMAVYMLMEYKPCINRKLDKTLSPTEWEIVTQPRGYTVGSLMRRVPVCLLAVVHGLFGFQI